MPFKSEKQRKAVFWLLNKIGAAGWRFAKRRPFLTAGGVAAYAGAKTFAIRKRRSEKRHKQNVAILAAQARQSRQEQRAMKRGTKKK